jgi:hypothetical protein
VGVRSLYLTIVLVSYKIVGHGTAPPANRVRRRALPRHLRGNDRKAIFKDNSDRELFLNNPGRVTERFHWICHGYCLMNNHITW